MPQVIGAKKQDSEKEGAKKEKLEDEMKELRATLEARQNEIKEKVVALARAQDGVTPALAPTHPCDRIGASTHPRAADAGDAARDPAA